MLYSSVSVYYFIQPYLTIIVILSSCFFLSLYFNNTDLHKLEINFKEKQRLIFKSTHYKSKRDLECDNTQISRPTYQPSRKKYKHFNPSVISQTETILALNVSATLMAIVSMHTILMLLLIVTHIVCGSNTLH